MAKENGIDSDADNAKSPKLYHINNNNNRKTAESNLVVVERKRSNFLLRTVS